MSPAARTVQNKFACIPQSGLFEAFGHNGSACRADHREPARDNPA